MLLKLLQFGLLVVLGFILVTQIIVPALKGQTLFPTFRDKKNPSTTLKVDNENHS